MEYSQTQIVIITCYIRKYHDTASRQCVNRRRKRRKRIEGFRDVNVSYRVKWSFLGESVSVREDVQNHGRIPECRA